MEDVIRKIIKIEEKAQAIMEETLKENETKRREAQDMLMNLEEKIIGDAYRKAKELRKMELRENAVKAKEIKGQCDTRLQSMKAKADENEDKWVGYLVDAVLGD